MVAGQVTLHSRHYGVDRDLSQCRGVDFWSEYRIELIRIIQRTTEVYVLKKDHLLLHVTMGLTRTRLCKTSSNRALHRILQVKSLSRDRKSVV